jgi:hypothetical protein
VADATPVLEKMNPTSTELSVTPWPGAAVAAALTPDNANMPASPPAVTATNERSVRLLT